MPNLPQKHLWHIEEKVTVGNLLYDEKLYLKPGCTMNYSVGCCNGSKE